MKQLNISVLTKGFIITHDEQLPPTAPASVLHQVAYRDYPSAPPAPPAPYTTVQAAFTSFDELVGYLRERLAPETIPCLDEEDAPSAVLASSGSYDHAKWERRNNRQWAVNAAAGVFHGTGDGTAVTKLADAFRSFVNEDDDTGPTEPQQENLQDALRRVFSDHAGKPSPEKSFDKDQ